MRIVVTGGCGFIGSHVVDALLSAGHDVVVVDSAPVAGAASRANPAADYVAADILDVPALTAAMQGCEAVFHLAAMADVDAIALDPVRATRTNIEGTVCVLEAARHSGCDRFILASSVWVYGATDENAAPPHEELTEDVPFDLRHAGHLYVTHKLAAELAVHSYHDLHNQHYTILRYGIPYGPRMRDQLVIARFVQAALDGRPITIAGDGGQTRNWVYVEDLADAHVRALCPEAQDQTFTLEGDTAVSIREVADTVDALVGPLTIEHAPARPGDYSSRAISISKAKSLLDWTPITPFDVGVRRYVEWYQSTEAERGKHLAPALT